MAGLASMIQGVSRRRAALAGFVIFGVLVLVLPLAGCTDSSASPRAAGSPAATQRGPASATPAASVCTATQIKAARSTSAITFFTGIRPFEKRFGKQPS